MAKKVFCKDCKNFRGWVTLTNHATDEIGDIVCGKTIKEVVDTPIERFVRYTPLYPEKENQDNNCPYYEPSAEKLERDAEARKKNIKT